jgi:hypothetical protein
LFVEANWKWRTRKLSQRLKRKEHSGHGGVRAEMRWLRSFARKLRGLRMTKLG